MAGNGGFKTAINGFDKNEVNEYIGNLRKKLQEMEAEIKGNDEKTRAAVKTAEEADSRIKDIEAKHASKIAELEAQIKTERRNADTLQNENDELKRKLRHAGSGAGSASAAGGANTAEAEKRAAEIVDKANATARDIVEKAKQTAHQMISGAGGAQGGGVSREALDSFNAILRDLSNSVNDAFAAANRKASEITGAPAAAAPTLDLSAFSAPQAEIPAPKAAAPAPKPEPAAVDDIFADLADDGGDMADFGAIKEEPANSGGDTSDGFDMSDLGGFISEEPVDEVAPLDMGKTNKAVVDEGFTTELLTQTVPSSLLKDQVDEDLFAAVKEREEQFAVQPADEEKDFDMGDPADGLDAMNALLGQMGAALESAGGNSGLDLEELGASSDSSASDNPWADLQNQLNAMEETGDFGGGSSAEPEPANIVPTEDPKVPDADDSSIWNFDDDMSSGSSDDDMSADLFGSF